MSDKQLESTFGVWCFFVVLPLMYGLECIVAYGSRWGFRFGWGVAWPFVLFAGCSAIIGVILEVRRSRKN